MAQPIEFRPTPHSSREALQRRLDEAPIEHVDALLASYDLLQQLHDRGVLDVLRGALGAGDEIVLQLSGVLTEADDGARSSQPGADGAESQQSES
jgi:hypothetical protein